MDQLARAPCAGSYLPSSDDPALAAVLHMLQAQPGDNRTLAALAQAAHTTERTLMRRAQRDLGMSLLEWRQRLRVGWAGGSGEITARSRWRANRAFSSAQEASRMRGSRQGESRETQAVGKLALPREVDSVNDPRRDAPPHRRPPNQCPESAHFACGLGLLLAPDRSGFRVGCDDS